MTQFFIADPHYMHPNIIKLGERPFESYDQMENHMIDVWNARVKSSDDVWVIGDFILTDKQVCPERIEKIVRRLRGTIHLVRGNHDQMDKLASHIPRRIRDEGDLVYLPIGHKISELHHIKRIVACHYPLERWHWSHKTLHIHGHTHATKSEPFGGLAVRSHRLNLCVDALYHSSQAIGSQPYTYQPITAEEMLIMHLERLRWQEKTR